MPLYEHECNNCAHRYERHARIAMRNGLHSCPECDTVASHRRIPSVATPILFKPGFYEHASADGVWADTPQQLQDELNKSGGTSTYLDGTFKVRKDYSAYEETEHRKLQERKRREANEGF